MVTHTEVKPGTIVDYRLKPSDRPTNILRLWKGKVRQCTTVGILVEILDEGYEGLGETISYEQILSIHCS
jgi:hypothetical protein